MFAKAWRLNRPGARVWQRVQMRLLVGLASSCQPRYHLWGVLVGPNAAFTWLRTRWLAPLGLCLPKPSVLFQPKSKDCREFGVDPGGHLRAMFYQSTSDVFENAFTPVGEKSEVCRAEKSDRVLVVRRALLRGELVRRKKNASGRDPSGWTSDAVLSKIIAYDHWHIFKWNTSLPRLETC
jgi:hypothetical protein